jgi:hypothetical protein
MVVLYGWWLWAHGGSAVASRTVGSTRDVTCTYLAQVNHLPHDARRIHVWVPLAKTGQAQRILRRDVRAPVPYTIAQDPDYGNEMLHARLTPPIPERVEIVSSTAPSSSTLIPLSQNPPRPPSISNATFSLADCS